MSGFREIKLLLDVKLYRCGCGAGCEICEWTRYIQEPLEELELCSSPE